ncbi:L-threonylcarbamoyladenylate synthase [Abiotrophia sp.]|uniref:L-threonylcarbamoyladenylate synthase n=2 Tax=Abiotrophia TaxID=46123 RepID=UPI001CB3DABE|nr:L-threonylcarbamoyladenylate synthase [Abiotrophia sp.]MBF0937266.1 threonylcarbamoyl-AMP synthase [Abiotrophia sp.]MBF0941739.1 threonylcarbamoyl-AMP synthase [Abiotrophia sp.]
MLTKKFRLGELDEAAALLRRGELVAFPTETVYGLGAIATKEQAVAKVFQAKGRPSDNPLIVHVKDAQQVFDYAAEVPKLAKDLMERFWPGPLTIILPVKPGVFPANVNNDQETVAFRMPNQHSALRLIDLVGAPLVGPSANLSGKPSPTSVDHVMQDFDGVISGVVAGDTDQAQIGVESTVVRPMSDRLIILRPGAITQSMLKQVCPKVQEFSVAEQLAAPQLQSPGVKYRHYSPKQAVFLFESSEDLANLHAKLVAKGGRVGLLADESIIQALGQQSPVVATYSLGQPNDADSATRQLYAGLRALEASDCDWILAQAVLESEKYHAYMNRLNKAATSML